MCVSKKVPAKSGPDRHGSIVVECPWCFRDHVFTLNTFNDDLNEMIRPAGCLASAGANLIIRVDQSSGGTSG